MIRFILSTYIGGCINGVGVDVASTTHVPRVINMSRGKSLSEVECGKILTFHEKGHLKWEITGQSQFVFVFVLASTATIKYNRRRI